LHEPVIRRDRHGPVAGQVGRLGVAPGRVFPFVRVLLGGRASRRRQDGRQGQATLHGRNLETRSYGASEEMWSHRWPTNATASPRTASRMTPATNPPNHGNFSFGSFHVVLNAAYFPLQSKQQNFPNGVSTLQASQ